MKKRSKVIGKDYDKLEKEKQCDRIDYYGLISKDGRIKIDTKRYKKFFTLPDNKIENRHSVYYLPTKQHRFDYKCNWFRDLLAGYKELWFSEYKSFIDSIKTPKQVEDNARVAYLADGVLDYDEVNEKAFMAGLRRTGDYKVIIKSLYAQFFHQLMSSIDALCLKMLTACGYKEEDYTKKQFDIYMQGLQGDNAVAFRQYNNYQLYDRAFTVWNFLKHNSLRSYKTLKQWYPKMVWDPKEKYQNGESALSVVKLDEKFILDCIDNMHLFFDEMCARAFGENADDAQWDYDDYFYEEVQDQIDVIVNPLGI